MITKNIKKGFSLVELLVVITIIAILSVTAYVALGGQTAKAKNSRRMQDLGTIQSALEIYYIENSNSYPALLNDLVSGKQMQKIPTDPTSGKSYEYETNTAKKEYELAATLDTEAAPYYKAYLVGNATSSLIDGVKPSDGTSCGGKVTDGSTTCIPYTP